MRALVTFFLFVCFCLLGALPSSVATKQQGSAAGSPFAKLVKAGATEQERSKRHLFITKSHDLAAESECPLIAEDDDDQEEGSRKTRSSVEGWSAWFRAFGAGSSASDPAPALSFCPYPIFTSHGKYIVQRALRI